MGTTAAENHEENNKGTAVIRVCAKCARPLLYCWLLLADGRAVHIHCRPSAIARGVDEVKPFPMGWGDWP